MRGEGLIHRGYHYLMSDDLKSVITARSHACTNGIYYLSKPGAGDEGMAMYLSTRTKEGRIYSDAVVKALPHVQTGILHNVNASRIRHNQLSAMLTRRLLDILLLVREPEVHCRVSCRSAIALGPLP